jgi:hypothetical protein
VAFNFTYSKIKDFEQCGLQHYHASILKTPGTQPSGDAIDHGKKVHDVLHQALRTDGQQKELPHQFKYLQPWVDYVNWLPGDRYVEIKWGMDRDYQPHPFFNNATVWMRYVGDVAGVYGGAGWLLDWKTGKRLEEPLQLWLGALMMFTQFPQLQTIRSMFVWLKEYDGTNRDECISVEIIKRAQAQEIWTGLLPRIKAYEQACETGNFLPKPGRHCGWCRVQACEFFGKGR